MDKSYKIYLIHRMVLWFACLALFLLFKPAIGFSKSPLKGLIRSGSVTIEGKTSDAILVSERRFTVAESTTIIDVKNNKIELSALPVPCRADIKYRLIMDQDPVTLKIKVKRLLKGATKNWPPWGLERSTTRTRNRYSRGGFLKNQ